MKLKIQFVIITAICFMSACDFINSKGSVLSLQTEIDTASIKFQYSTLKSAIDISKEIKKPILIYFTADGCGPCVKMERSVFTDSLVSEFYNANFISIKSHERRLSRDGIVRTEEKRLNKPIYKIKEKYKIHGNPSFVIIDSDWKLIHKSIGFKNQSEFIQFGKDALSSDRNYSAIETKIKNGDYSFETVKIYLEGNHGNNSLINKIFGSSQKKIISKYFDTQNPSEWSSHNNWFIIDGYINDFHSEQFQYLLNNRELFYKNMDRITIDKKLFSVLSNYAFNGGNIESLDCPISSLILNRKYLNEKGINDLNAYALESNDQYLSYYYLLEFEINNISLMIYEESIRDNNSIEVETINMASNWMKLVTSYYKDFKYFNDTYEKLQSQLININ